MSYGRTIHGGRPHDSRLGGRPGCNERLHQQHFLHRHAGQGVRFQLASDYFRALHLPGCLAGLQIRRALLSKNKTDFRLRVSGRKARRLGTNLRRICFRAVYDRARRCNPLLSRPLDGYVRSVEHRGRDYCHRPYYYRLHAARRYGGRDMDGRYTIDNHDCRHSILRRNFVDFCFVRAGTINTGGDKQS